MRDGLQVEMAGPLARYALGFRLELDRVGYATRSAATLIGLMGRLSSWMADRGLDERALTPQIAESFLSEVRGSGGWFQPTMRQLASLLDYLSGLGVVPQPAAPAAVTPLDRQIESYRRYLLDERGLVPETASHYVAMARLFLPEFCDQTQVDWTRVGLSEVMRFVTRECAPDRPGSAKNLITGLRALLRYAQWEGLTPLSLAQAVPSAAGWTGTGLPQGLLPGEARRLLAACDRRRATGRRNYAIVVLLLRLGLRAGEVATLTLDDVDWAAGEIMVHGKGGCQESLPLPPDVGAAMVGYLRRGRPVSEDRALFLRVHAPIRSLTSHAVSEVVRVAGERAGLPGIGAHRLRHTAATEMLRAGAPLSEVAQVLRQRSTKTAAIYAKVDHLELRALALPWPAGAR